MYQLSDFNTMQMDCPNSQDMYQINYPSYSLYNFRFLVGNDEKSYTLSDATEVIKCRCAAEEAVIIQPRAQIMQVIILTRL